MTIQATSLARTVRDVPFGLRKVVCAAAAEKRPGTEEPVGRVAVPRRVVFGVDDERRLVALLREYIRQGAPATATRRFDTCVGRRTLTEHRQVASLRI
jgi:hypothetical protein